jgi:hypothetical protein
VPEYVRNGRSQLLFRHQRADQPFDDRTGDLDRDAARTFAISSAVSATINAGGNRAPSQPATPNAA